MVLRPADRSLEHLNSLTDDDASRHFPASLGKRLSVLAGLGYALVLLVGAASLLSAYAIYKATADVREQTRHIRVMDGIHLALHHVAAATRDALIRGEAPPPASYAPLVATLEERLRRYEELERGEVGDFPERERELRLYAEIQHVVAELVPLSDRIVTAVREGRTSAPEDVEALSALIQTMPPQVAAMNEIHQAKIRRAIESSETRMYAIVALYLVFLLLGSLLLAGASRFVARRVVHPITEMSASALAIARGDLAQRVMVASHDEIGQLAHTFNVMAQRLGANEHALRSVNERLERKVAEVEALYRMGTEVAAALQPGRVTDATLAHTRPLLGADLVGIALLDEETGNLVWKARGPDDRTVAQLRLAPGAALAGTVLRAGRPLVVEDLTAHSHTATLEGCPPLAAMAAAVAVPLRRGREPMGVLLVAYREARHFDDESLVLLSSAAHLAAVAMENARLYTRAQAAAVLEERERLAREMHDGLAQALGAILLKARAGRAGTRETLAAIEDIAHRAYQDVRQAIFGLRLMVTRQLGLIPTLGEYLHDFSRQSGLPVDLRVAEGAGETLPPDAEVQLVRILQEALANTRAHAAATRAWVSVATKGHCLEVEISDDGRGFDPAAPSLAGTRRFGLQTMLERARSVGGDLEIDSAPGRGTTVRARIPLGP